MAAVAWYRGNSMLVTWPLRNEADGSLITGADAVTVQASVFDAGTDTAIEDDQGNSINPVSMSYDSDEEEWQGTAPADADLDGIDQVDIHYSAEGGDDLTADRWDRSVEVKERSG